MEMLLHLLHDMRSYCFWTAEYCETFSFSLSKTFDIYVNITYLETEMCWFVAGLGFIPNI